MPEYPWEPHTCTEALEALGWGPTLTAVAAEEPPRIAEGLQAQFPHLAPGARIAWAYVVKELRDGGAPCIAKTNLVSKAAVTQLEVVGGLPFDKQPHYLVELNLDQWLECTDAEQRAVIHHELCHVTQRNGRWTLAPHDLHEFDEVVREHGLCFSDVRRFAEALQPHLPGLDDRPARLDAQMGNRLREAAGEGATVTLSSGDQSVTLTGKAPSGDLAGVDFTEHETAGVA